MAAGPEGSPLDGTARVTPRWVKIAVPLLLLVHAGACWFARPIGYLTGQDDLEYVTLGQSLRHGGYSFLFRVDQPLHAQYPPGYPAMLSLWGAVTGDGFHALAALSVILSAGALLLTWTLTRRFFDDRIAIVTLGLLAINPALVNAGGGVASEAPFTFLSMLAIFLVAGEGRSPRYVAWAGVVTILAALTRTIGVVLIGAVGLHWLLQGRWKRVAIFAVASIATVGVWLLWTAAAPEQYGGSSYIADLQNAVRPGVVSAPFGGRILRRIDYYATQGLPFTMGVPTIGGTPVDNVVTTLLLMAGLAIGCWLMLRRWRLAALLILLYGALLLTWTWRTDRFLIPVIPVLVPMLLVGVSMPFAKRRPRVAVVTLATTAILLLAGGLPRVGRQIAERAGCRGWTDLPPAECLSEGQIGFFDAVRYIREAVAPDDLFLAGKPGALWYYSGHQSISYPEANVQEPDSFMPYLKEQGARWILLGTLEQGEWARLAERLEANCTALSLERRFAGQTYLFRVLNEGESVRQSEGAGDACEAVKEYRDVAARRTDT